MKITNTIVAAVVAFCGCTAWTLGAEPQSLNIVFIGDSITYGYLLKQPEKEAPPAQAAAFLRRMPEIASVRFRNCGRNGFRTDQFLPDRPNSAWPQVKQAADTFKNEPGVLLFSIMLGANDSGLPTAPDQYGRHLKSLIDALLENFQNSQIIVHHPLWYSKVPSTHPEVLKQYIPVIDSLIATFGQQHPGRAHLGDAKGWDRFEKSHPSICFKEKRDNLPYYIHPNEQGTQILGEYWGKAIFKACFEK